MTEKPRHLDAQVWPLADAYLDHFRTLIGKAYPKLPPETVEANAIKAALSAMFEAGAEKLCGPHPEGGRIAYLAGAAYVGRMIAPAVLAGPEEYLFTVVDVVEKIGQLAHDHAQAHRADPQHFTEHPLKSELN